MDKIESKRIKASRNSLRELVKTQRPYSTEMLIGIASNLKIIFGNLILSESGHGGIYNLLLQVIMILGAAIGWILIKYSASIFYYSILIVPVFLFVKVCNLYTEATAITLIRKPVNNGSDCNHGDNS